MPRSPLPPIEGVPEPMRRWMQLEVEPAVEKFEDIVLVFPAAPNTLLRVRHRLGRAPAGFEVLDKSVAADVYRAGIGTRFMIPLKCTVGSAKVTVRLR